MKNNTIYLNVIVIETIEYDMIQYNIVQNNTIHYETIYNNQPNKAVKNKKVISCVSLFLLHIVTLLS